MDTSLNDQIYSIVLNMLQNRTIENVTTKKENNTNLSLLLSSTAIRRLLGHDPSSVGWL